MTIVVGDRLSIVVSRLCKSKFSLANLAACERRQVSELSPAAVTNTATHLCKVLLPCNLLSHSANTRGCTKTWRSGVCGRRERSSARRQPRFRFDYISLSARLSALKALVALPVPSHHVSASHRGQIGARRAFAELTAPPSRAYRLPAGHVQLHTSQAGATLPRSIHKQSSRRPGESKVSRASSRSSRVARRSPTPRAKLYLD